MTTLPLSEPPAHRQHKVVSVGIALLCAALMSACSVSGSIGTFEVDKANLERQVAAQLDAQNPDNTVPIITCPGDLEAKVGAKTTCVLTVKGDTGSYDVDVTITSVNKDTKRVEFDIAVANQPN